MIKAMLSSAFGCRLKRSENGGLVKVPMTQSLSLKPVVGFQPSFGLELRFFLFRRLPIRWKESNKRALLDVAMRHLT